MRHILQKEFGGYTFCAFAYVPPEQLQQHITVPFTYLLDKAACFVSTMSIMGPFRWLSSRCIPRTCPTCWRVTRTKRAWRGGGVGRHASRIPSYTKGVYMGVSSNGGNPISHTKMIIFSRKHHTVVGETQHFRKPRHMYPLWWGVFIS